MKKLFAELGPAVMCRVLFLMGLDPRSSAAAEEDDKELKIEEITPPEEPDESLVVDEECFVSMCALSNRIICKETTM